ncbi:MAG: hypothetical protein ACXAC8_17210 [Candidatus Hodarchaeales archaeon]|jgi:hypothetical protein
MKVNYRFWEPNQDLEELQAKIYNENTGQSVTAKEITDRFDREKIDPKTVQYALDKEGNPLAYIQARDYPQIKETHLGYPWALSNCPAEVQDKLFDEMLEYIKQRDVSYDIRMNADVNRNEIVEFFKKKGLVEKSKNYRYELDVINLSKTDYTEEDYKSRLATTEDLDLLVNLMKADKRYEGQFSTDDDLENYFKDRVLKDGHCILVFKDDTLVMSSAPLIFKYPNDDEERLILRFHSYLADHEKAMKSLIISIAKECASADYGTDRPLSVFIGAEETDFANILEVHKPNKVVTGITFGLK